MKTMTCEGQGEENSVHLMLNFCIFPPLFFVLEELKKPSKFILKVANRNTVGLVLLTSTQE